MKSEDLEARITALMERCRDLHEDVDLQSVKDWKKSTGGRAVGSLPIYVPDEILHAAGILPVGLIGGGDRVDVIRGDAYFQSYICRLPRSMVELGLSERLDVLDGVLFPAICDVIRNLSGIWTMLFPDQFVRFVDFPQNFDPEIGGSFYRGELQHLADDMATLSGTEITTAALNEAITLYDINRKLILKLHHARQETPDDKSVLELLAHGSVLNKPAGGCDDRILQFDPPSPSSHATLEFDVFAYREIMKPSDEWKVERRVKKAWSP